MNQTTTRSEAFTQLGQVTKTIAELKGKLAAALKQEADLYTFLKLPNPADKPEKPRRARITKEKALHIRRKVMAVMRNLSTTGIADLPISLIVKATNQEMPNALESEIETQIRALAASESAPVEHNGERGPNSSYRYTGTRPTEPPPAK